MFWLKNKIKSFKIWYSFLIIIFSFFFLPHIVKAEDSFDSYSINTPSTNVGFVAVSGLCNTIGSSSVQYTPVYTSNKAIYLNKTSGGCLIKEVSPVIETFYYYGKDNGSGHFGYYLYNANKEALFVVTIYQNSVWLYNGASTYVVLNTGVNYNRWVKIRMDYNTSTCSYTITVDDVYTQTTNTVDNHCQNSSSIKWVMYDSDFNNLGKDDFYIDGELYGLVPPTYTSLHIENPTEGYSYANVQPMPFMFTYRNDVGAYDKVWIQIDQLHDPQYSLSPLSYNISTTSATTTGMVYSSLAQGSYRLQGFLYNSQTDTLSSSTGYVNFTVSTSTVPVGTIPSYTDQDFNELTKTPIWSTSSVESYLDATLNCKSGNWWDKITCNVAKAVIAVPEGMMKGYSLMVDGFLFVVKSVFPFNLPIAFLSAWNSSTDTLPSGLTFINDTVDSAGNVYLSLPSQWSASTSVPIFGTIAFSSFTSANGFFAFIKALSPIIMWGIFIFSLWGLASDVLRDIIGIKTGKNID